MTQPTAFTQKTGSISRAADWRLGAGLLLTVGLLAFEIFNFDTTQYALGNLMGDVSFLGLRWATVLAIAFCAIDFAGLLRILKPEHDQREAWYLMGAWLLAATMNAIMTWWAVTLTLLNHDLGNEVLSRAQLINTVPIFIAVLVWLTRILFIGAFTVAGEHLFDRATDRPAAQPVPARKPTGQPVRAPRAPRPTQPPVRRQPVRQRQPAFSFADAEQASEPVAEMPTQVVERPSRQPSRPSRIQRRPPMPGRQPVPMSAKGRNGR